MKKALFILLIICFISILLLMGDYYSDEVVNFQDQKVEVVIKKVLGTSKKYIFKNDLKAITVLDASGKAISRLEGLEYLHNLEELNLKDNRIIDIAPLKDLIQLKVLHLGDNQIKDITHIKNLVNIEKLDLSNNQIKDIDALISLKKLEDLNINNNQIESIRALKHMGKLTRRVSIHGNPIIDYSPIADYYNKINKTKNKEFLPSISHYKTQGALVINEVMASNGKTIADGEGNYSDWIELYNAGNSSINLHGFGLSDSIDEPCLWRFPDISIKADDFLLVWASGDGYLNQNKLLHTNFKICKYGEPIILADPEGVIVDAIRVEPGQRDMSFGRKYNGSKEWVFFKKPSPGSDNIALEFSHESGFYTEPFDLKIGISEEETTIYYTLDCTEPTQKSLAYSSPIRIKSRKGEKNNFSEISTTSIYWSKPISEVFKGTIVRAMAYRNNLPVSNIITKTYFVDKKMPGKYKIPIISLVTDPKNFFDYQKGIYVKGKVFDNFEKKNPERASIKNTKGNFLRKGKAWERPIHIDFFEPNGFLGFSQDAGIRIFGGKYNRTLSQKPFCIYTRRKYDPNNYINYEIFPGLRKSKESNEVLNKFKHVLLRTSGQDSAHTMFGDAMMQSLVEDILDTQAYRPGVVFLNGEYWGIYNIREHMDEHYLESHYDIDKTNIALLASYIGIKAGSKKDREDFLNNILRFVIRNDMTDQDNYNYIKSQMDVDNFIDYTVAQIYFNNRDWPGNNIRYWRRIRTQNIQSSPYGHDGRWRWLVFDTDYGFGRSRGVKAHHYNTLKFATKEGGVRGPNKGKSTRLLRILLKNHDFRNSFINRFADYLNTIFRKDVVIEKINKIQKNIASEMKKHIQRWGTCERSIHSIKTWNKKVRYMRYFAKTRPRHMRKHIIDYFGLEGIGKVVLNVSNSSSGTIKINTIKLNNDKYPWEGIYFKDVPIQITAIPNKGFSFAGWEGNYEENSNAVTINLKNDISLTACFEKGE